MEGVIDAGATTAAQDLAILSIAILQYKVI